MRFNKAQIIILLVLLSLVAYLFYMNYKTPESELKPTTGANRPDAKPFDFQSYKTSLNDSLSFETKANIAEQTKIVESADAGVFAIAQLAKSWDSLGFRLVAADYLEKVANKVNDENSWFKAGQKYYEFSAITEDTGMQIYSTSKAITSFEKVVALNENNIEAKNSLAICYIQNDLDIMKAVQILKDIIKRDSNDINANYTLGMLSMRSGQMDKAAQRFETLTKLNPTNPDFYYFLGQCYMSMENKNQAIRAFETFQKLVPDEEAKKNIETTIINLKNSK